MKERWISNERKGKLQEIRDIYQELKSKGVQRVLENLKDPSGDTALMLATRNGHLDICQLLMRKNLVNVNEKDKYGCMYAFHWVARKNLTEIARLFFEKTSIEANEQTNKGWTALHEAAFQIA